MREVKEVFSSVARFRRVKDNRLLVNLKDGRGVTVICDECGKADHVDASPRKFHAEDYTIKCSKDKHGVQVRVVKDS